VLDGIAGVRRARVFGSLVVAVVSCLIVALVVVVGFSLLPRRVRSAVADGVTAAVLLGVVLAEVGVAAWRVRAGRRAA
jgi:hypothetical protein